MQTAIHLSPSKTHPGCPTGRTVQAATQMLPESYTSFSPPRTTQDKGRSHTSSVLSSQAPLLCSLSGQLVSSKKVTQPSPSTPQDESSDVTPHGDSTFHSGALETLGRWLCESSSAASHQCPLLTRPVRDSCGSPSLTAPPRHWLERQKLGPPGANGRTPVKARQPVGGA